MSTSLTSSTVIRLVRGPIAGIDIGFGYHKQLEQHERSELFKSLHLLVHVASADQSSPEAETAAVRCRQVYRLQEDAISLQERTKHEVRLPRSRSLLLVLAPMTLHCCDEVFVA